MATPGDGRMRSKQAGGEEATAARDTGTFKRSTGGKFEFLLHLESCARVSSRMDESRARELLDEKCWERVLLLLRGEGEDPAGVGPAVEVHLKRLLHAPVPRGVSKTEYYKHRQHRLNALCATPHATRLLREFVGQFDGCLEW
eukprot:Hpha_TRINITY_DN16430_c2_g1::TRINITY_DN16430_c2_g1_i20::g.158871::m.158871